MDNKLADVLLVEDSIVDIKMVQVALKQSKLVNDIIVVSDGQHAIDYLSDDINVPPDLIILDLNLPHRNGLEVLSYIKDHDHLALIPVIVMTSSRSERDVLESYRLRANCYIIKPLDAEKFIEAVRKVDEFWTELVKLPSDL